MKQSQPLPIQAQDKQGRKCDCDCHMVRNYEWPCIVCDCTQELKPLKSLKLMNVKLKPGLSGGTTGIGFRKQLEDDYDSIQPLKKQWEEEYAQLWQLDGQSYDRIRVFIQSQITQAREEGRREAVEEIKDYVVDGLRLLEIVHGMSVMKGEWINYEDLIDFLDHLQERNK